jgi:MHS family proline/betaine transporter-like MFS transporter
MLTGMLLGVLLYRPIFQQLYQTANLEAKTVAGEQQNMYTEPEATPNPESLVQVRIVTQQFSDGTQLTSTTRQKLSEDASKASLKKEIRLNAAGKWKMIFLVAVMVLFVTMVYGPIAAFLVELFPTRIRYTSMSLPYHIGNGVFGGLVPFIATLITTLPGTNHLSGLWYPIGVAALSFVIGLLYLTNKTRND